MEDLDIDYSLLFDSPPARNRPSSKLKPNTRFLQHIVREANSHNAALLARETADSRARLRRLMRHDNGNGDDEYESYGEEKNKARESRKHRERPRSSRDDESHRSKRRSTRHGGRDDGTAETRHHRSQHRRHRHGSEDEGSRADDRSREENDRRHRRRREEDRGDDDCASESEAKARRHSTRHKSRHGDEGHSHRSRQASRSRSSERSLERSRHHRRRESAKSSRRRSQSPRGDSERDRDRRRRHRERSPHEKRGRRGARIVSPKTSSAQVNQSLLGETSKDGLFDTRGTDDGDEDGRSPSVSDADSDPLDEFIGPRQASSVGAPSANVRARGRGAASMGATNMDRHFSASYDPSTDIELPPITASAPPGSYAAAGSTVEDARIEMQRDRQQLLRDGAERLRAAGFTDKEIAIWARGGKRQADDIQWSKQGEAREWDRGKVEGDDGPAKPLWAR